jgi:hypothetical protein
VAETTQTNDTDLGALTDVVSEQGTARGDTGTQPEKTCGQICSFRKIYVDLHSHGSSILARNLFRKVEDKLLLGPHVGGVSSLRIVTAGPLSVISVNRRDAAVVLYSLLLSAF